jgi:hypothetical protein
MPPAIRNRSPRSSGPFSCLVHPGDHASSKIPYALPDA